MKILLGVSITLLLILSTPAAKAADSWALYDDFNSKFLDIDNWTASESTTGGVVILEGVREIEGHRLYVRTRAYYPGWNAEYRQRGDNRIFFRNPDLILGLKASIKVNEIEVTQCPDSGADATRASARIQGYFFKTKTNQECLDNPDDCAGSNNSVGAQISIERLSDSQDPPNLLRIVGRVIHCNDSNCFDVDVSPDPPFELGTIRVRQWATVSLEWNGDSNDPQAIFQFGREQPVTFPLTDYYVGSVTRTYKIIGTLTRFPSCSEGEIALIGADFDNVFIK